MDDLSLAVGLVKEAGSLAARMLADGLETRYKKSISDVVSEADLAAENLISSRLIAARPLDALVGEEGTRAAGAGDSGRTWYVDPVDGTYNFLASTPYWCSAVGLADGDGLLAGAVYYPAFDELWAGGIGRRTTRNGVEVALLEDRPLSDLAVNTYAHPASFGDGDRLRTWQAVVSHAATIRMMGSASIDLASVAGSRTGLFLQVDLSPWDWVPGAALVEAAGGVAVTVQAADRRWHVAGNALAVEQARELLLA